jgi:excisionase family DNA binding protein
MKIYRIAEAAQILNVSAWFIRKECKAGRMPYHQNGAKMVFFTEDDLQEYLRRTACNTSPATQGGAK